MVSMRAQLVPIDGGSPVELAKDMVLVGRKDDCDLRLDHKSVSKLHCVLVKTDGLLLLRDLGSTNGTRVNGQRVRRAALLPNDRLTIANFHYRIIYGTDLVDAPASPEEHTMHMDAREVQELLNKPAREDAMGQSSLDAPMNIQANALPDVYPADENRKD